MLPPDVRDWLPDHVVWVDPRGCVGDRPETVLADAGYWHEQQIEDIVSDGIQVLVPPESGLRKGDRPGWDKGMYAFMRSVLAREHGHAIY
jgi:hypothetical protein